MGKVFSPEEIESGRIPKPGAHRQAAEYILASLAREQSYDGIAGVLVYGSTTTGSANVRSDLDVLVSFYNKEVQSGLQRVQSTFQSAEERYHVPVEPHISRVNSYPPYIDPLFAKHLIDTAAQEEWSRGTPVEMLFEHTVAAEKLGALALNYIALKSVKMAKGIVNYRGEPDLATLQRAFELPSALGRKIVPALRENADALAPTYSRQDLRDSTKELLEELAGETLWGYRNAQLALNHRTLDRLDKEYSTVLAATLAGTVSLEAYDQWIRTNYLEALSLAEQVATGWAHTLPMYQFGHEYTPEEGPNIDGERWIDAERYIIY
jgi:predicted nucleotidyltransferase